MVELDSLKNFLESTSNLVRACFMHVFRQDRPVLLHLSKRDIMETRTYVGKGPV